MIVAIMILFNQVQSLIYNASYVWSTITVISNNKNSKIVSTRNITSNGHFLDRSNNCLI